MTFFLFRFYFFFISIKIVFCFLSLFQFCSEIDFYFWARMKNHQKKVVTFTYKKYFISLFTISNVYHKPSHLIRNLSLCFICFFYSFNIFPNNMFILYSKSIKIKAVFTKTERNNEWNINFLQDGSLGIQYCYLSVFNSSKLLVRKVWNCGGIWWIYRVLHLYNTVFHQKLLYKRIKN